MTNPHDLAAVLIVCRPFRSHAHLRFRYSASAKYKAPKKVTQSQDLYAQQIADMAKPCQFDGIHVVSAASDKSQTIPSKLRVCRIGLELSCYDVCSVFIYLIEMVWALSALARTIQKNESKTLVRCVCKSLGLCAMLWQINDLKSTRK